MGRINDFIQKSLLCFGQNHYRYLFLPFWPIITVHAFGCFTPRAVIIGFNFTETMKSFGSRLRKFREYRKTKEGKIYIPSYQWQYVIQKTSPHFDSAWLLVFVCCLHGYKFAWYLNWYGPSTLVPSQDRPLPAQVLCRTYVSIYGKITFCFVNNGSRVNFSAY